MRTISTIIFVLCLLIGVSAHASDKKQLFDERCKALFEKMVDELLAEAPKDEKFPREGVLSKLKDLVDGEYDRAKKERTEAERGERIRGLLVTIKESILNEPFLKIQLEDYLNTVRAKVLIPSSSVSLLVGTMGETLSSDYKDKIKAITRYIAETNGHVVIYDADSPAAPLIRATAGKRCLGISAFPTEVPGVLTITNPYLRMEIFVKAAKVVAATNSLVGMGIAINGGAKAIWDIGNRTSETSWGVRKWYRSLESQYINLGVSSYFAPTVYSTVDSLRTRGLSLIQSYSVRDINFSAEIDPAKFEYDTLKEAIAYSYQMNQLAHAQYEIGGAVVFGTSRGSGHKFSDLIYEFTRVLADKGIAITTGGSTGAMEIANTAAFDAGTHSIGIPIGGKSKLDSEKTVADSVHTLTLASSDYETRIPMLLYRKPLVVFAPGGSGTVKELATAMIDLVSFLQSEKQVLFVSEGYYGELLNWIDELEISPAIKARFNVVKDAEEADQLVSGWLERGVLQANGLISTPDAKPRNDRRAFVRKPSEYSPRGYGGFGGFND